MAQNSSSADGFAQSPATYQTENTVLSILKEFLESKVAVIGLVLLGFAIFLALCGPLISPQNPYDLSEITIWDNKLPPLSAATDGNLTYYLGTDDQGRDLLSSIIYGIRTSIGVALTSTLIAIMIGCIAGLFAAYFGGRIDSLIMRAVDLQLSFPTILVALLLLAIFGKGVDKVLIALIVVQWAFFARIVRGTALVEKNKEYIEAARCLGLPEKRIIFRHLLPNSLPQIIVVSSIRVASAIRIEATLSFLGVGMPVTKPSLGLLVSNGQDYMLSGQYWISFFPGIALLLLIISINLVGDRLRDILNPRLKR